MKSWLFISMAVLAIGLGACTDTFMVYKDGYGYFLGSNSKAKYDMLCDSGDFVKVLATSHLNKDTKDDLFRFSCSPERSSEKVKQIYASMTIDERRDIKRAFRTNGYEINYMAC